jgi:hypothetical protein
MSAAECPIQTPLGRALEAFPMNDTGWAIQMQNIQTYIKAKP